MREKIKKIFLKINPIKTNGNVCRLLEINQEKQEVKFQIKMKMPTLKCTIEEAVNNLNLINHISAIEACYLGGHYAETQNSAKSNNSKRRTTPVSFSIKKGTERCRILYENRDGFVGYYDKKLNEEFTEHPINIVKNENLIAHFNSSQAFYIGFLAGLKYQKEKNRPDKKEKRITNKKPYLRLV